MFAAMALPMSATAVAVASTKATRSDPAACTTARLMRSAGREKSALRVKSPGITSAVLTTSAVRPSFTAASSFLVPVTTRSQPSTRSAMPAVTRIALMSSCVLARRTWE
jgi:hypothetical protein